MKGWTKIPNAILRNPDISVGARLLWAFIASQNGVPMTEQFILNGLSCADQAFKKWREELVSLGLLTVEVRRPKPSVYTVHEIAGSTPDKGVKNTPFKGVKNTPLKRSEKHSFKGVKNTPFKGVKITPQKKTILQEELIQEDNDDVVMSAAVDKIETFREVVKHSPAKREQLCLLVHITPEQYDRHIDEICDEWKLTEMSDDRVNWAHFVNHLRKKAEIAKRGATREERGAELVARAKAELLTAIL